MQKSDFTFLIIPTLLVIYCLALFFFTAARLKILSKFEERIRSIFSARFFNLSFLTNFILFNFTSSCFPELQISIFNFIGSVISDISLLLKAILISIFLPSLVFFIFNSRIRQNFSEYSYKKKPVFSAYKDFIFSTLLGLYLTFFIFHLTLHGIKRLNYWFELNQMSLFDWLFFSASNVYTINNGFYFSFLFSIIISLAIFNSFWNLTNNGTVKKNHFMFQVMNLTIFLSILNLLYSLTNSTYNILKTHNWIVWVQKDTNLGLFALRISSIVLTFHFLNFFFNKVLKSSFLNLVLSGFSNKVKVELSVDGDKNETYSSGFVLQICFYLILISISELSIILENQNIYRNAINFGVAFIIDDYLIIHRYTTKFKKTIPSHNYKIIIVNVLLFFAGLWTLLTLELYLIMALYVIICLNLISIFLVGIDSEKSS